MWPCALSTYNQTARTIPAAKPAPAIDAAAIRRTARGTSTAQRSAKKEAPMSAKTGASPNQSMCVVCSVT